MNHLEKKTYIFGMIFLLSNKLQIIGDKMDPLLTVKQWLFLAGVLKCDNEDPSLSEISARIGSSRQNVKKIASILEKQGFISMKRDNADARMLRISLTDKVLIHLKKRTEMEQQFIEELFKDFKSEELLLFFSSIKKLEKNLIEMERGHENKEE